MIRLIDTHAHLTFPHYQENLQTVLQRAEQQNVRRIITVGTDPADSEAAVKLAEAFPLVLAAVGIHPHEAKDAAESAEVLSPLCSHPKVVAIGETGLDFHYDFSPRQKQEHLFEQHLELAARYNLPLIIHSREAVDRTLQIIKSSGLTPRAVFHCFTGTAEQAQKILDMGFYISFTGVITFRNATRLAQAAAGLPVERILIETDCPYMSPEPVRKVTPNEPAMVVHVLNKLAQSLGKEAEWLAETIWNNAVALFGEKINR